jgi:hypothetical protein
MAFAAHHLSSLVRCKLGGLLDPVDAVHRHIAAEIRKVRAEQYFVQSDDFSQYTQDRVLIRQSCIPIETPQCVSRGPPHVGMSRP